MIGTRSITEQDKPFLWNLNVAAMREHVEQVYGWHEDVVYDYFEKAYRPQSMRIIQVDEEDVGMIEVLDCPDCWVLSRIWILPAFQGRGIGSTVIQRVIDDVAGSHKPLRLQVFKRNRARRLYERLGFVQTAETETHIQMEFMLHRNA